MKTSPAGLCPICPLAESHQGCIRSPRPFERFPQRRAPFCPRTTEETAASGQNTDFLFSSDVLLSGPATPFPKSHRSTASNFGGVTRRQPHLRTRMLYPRLVWVTWFCSYNPKPELMHGHCAKTVLFIRAFKNIVT